MQSIEIELGLKFLPQIVQILKALGAVYPQMNYIWVADKPRDSFRLSVKCSDPMFFWEFGKFSGRMLELDELENG
jgi:hypothetical protein